MLAAVSSYARSCIATVKPLERESDHPMHYHGTATLHMVSAHIPSARQPNQTSKTLICKTIALLRLPVRLPLHRMSLMELYTE